MPKDSVCIESTSPNLSTISPGRKSDSENTSRQLIGSQSSFRYSHASESLRRKKSPSTGSSFVVSMRSVIWDFGLYSARPRNVPFELTTSMMPPGAHSPSTVSISDA